MGIYYHVSSEPHGMSGPEGGSSESNGWRLVAAGQTEPQGRRHELETSGRKGGDTPLGCSGRTALRREQCDRFAQASPHDRPLGAW
jgi:hypothetical protein